MSPEPGGVSDLLRAWGQGDARAGEDLLPLVYRELCDLAGVDARQAEIVELRYFGGLSETEVATLLSISRATVTREWQTARTWLYRRMTGNVPKSRDGNKGGLGVRDRE